MFATGEPHTPKKIIETTTNLCKKQSGFPFNRVPNHKSLVIQPAQRDQKTLQNGKRTDSALFNMLLQLENEHSGFIFPVVNNSSKK
jgi:hypothetical protein